MPTETIAGRKSFNIVCSPVLLYRVPLVVVLTSGPLPENEMHSARASSNFPRKRHRPSPWTRSGPWIKNGDDMN
jgi:hypothetical protein